MLLKSLTNGNIKLCAPYFKNSLRIRSRPPLLVFFKDFKAFLTSLQEIDEFTFSIYVSVLKSNLESDIVSFSFNTFFK